MRGSLLVACVSVALAAIVACASSGDEAAAEPPAGASDAGLPPRDAAVSEADVDAAIVEAPTCSPAGWCITPLPDADLTVKDIWPLPGRAFAVAESRTVGVKFLEWEDASATWRYIDDDTQNETGFGKYVGRIWASDENDVYFTVAPQTIYHGTREAPGKDWSWTRHQLEDKTPDQSEFHDHGYPIYRPLQEQWKSYPYPAFGVWGLGRNDVYAWYSNTIYHLTTVDGAPTWAPEYTANDLDDPSEHLYVLGAAGTNRDDIWFSIARDRESFQASCTVIVRRRPDEYRRIADGVIGGYFKCVDKPGFLRIGGTDGWLTDLQAQAANRFVGLHAAREVVQISVDGDNYAAAIKSVPYDVAQKALMSLWSDPNERLWLSGWGYVTQGADVWDGGAFHVSTISVSGAPVRTPMFQVRGTSTSNLWAIGVGHAFHKTTP